MTARDARRARVVGPARRTYACLEGRETKPSDYEITTTALLYYPARGFEVQTPVTEHYAAYQARGCLRSADWDSFVDPRQTTYSSYVAQRRDQEAFLDRSFERAPGPVSAALAAAPGFYSALRFPLHGFQMLAAYVGALAPSGRISVVAAFQAADELRRIQRICQWLGRSGGSAAALDARGRELWQQHPGFQPLRRLIEQLLVTYDWGEALIGLNGVAKPTLERLWFEQAATLADRQADEALCQTLRSLAEDGRWHTAWFDELMRFAADTDSANAAAIERSFARFQPLGAAALAAQQQVFDELLGGAMPEREADDARRR